jgi:hypothetical protein
MAMKTLAAAVVLSCALAARGQVLSEISMPPNGGNQRAEVSQWIGPVKVSIEYHSPNVHGGAGNDRTGHIWGELVKDGFFDEGFGPSRSTPWRAGANESTTIRFSHDVHIDGKTVKAGTYALFLAIDQHKPWTWILSTQIGWGSFQYDPKYDVLRANAAPQDAPYTEFLTYGFDERRPESAVAYLQWEKKRVSLKIEVPDANDVYVAEIRRELLAWPGFNWQNWQNAADFCAQKKINLDEALVWADRAIKEPFRNATFGHEDFSTYQTKASVLEAMGRIPEADATMEKAFRLPGADLIPVYVYGVTVFRAGRAKKSVEIFEHNLKLHPDDRFWNHVGLARAYTALGEKPKAIREWETALAHVPENRKFQIPAFEASLKKLKET